MTIKRPLILVIKKIFNLFGLEIHRKGRRRLSLQNALEHIKSKGFYPKTVVDVGVAKGTHELYKCFPDSFHILIEPLHEFEDDLRKISDKLENVDYSLVAAGEECGEITIHMRPDELYASSRFIETGIDTVARRVPLVTLDFLCRSKNLYGPYLIKVDAQGSELSVLEGAKEVLSATEVIILEVSLFRFYDGAPQLYEVINYMDKIGYAVYDIWCENYRPLDNALAQSEFLFVKKEGMFRNSHIYYTPKQRQDMILRNPDPKVLD